MGRQPRRGGVTTRALALACLAAAALVAAVAASGASLSHVSCGDSVAHSITLDASLSCTGNGLAVSADGITINLNGFTISGDDGASDIGIVVGDHDGVKIVNGVIRDFGRGVTTTGGDGLTLTNVTIRSSAGDGARLAGGSDQVRISASTFVDNGGAGILFVDRTDGSKISTSEAVSNGGSGIVISGDRDAISLVTATLNGGDGIRVASHSHGTGVQSSIAARNGQAGISLVGPDASADKLTGNTVVRNGDVGIYVENAAPDPGSGLGQNVVSGNLALANVFEGIVLGTGASGNVVSRNRAIGNGSRGFDVVAGGNAFSANSATGNSDDGFHFEASATLAKNVADANGATGIKTSGGVTLTDGGGNTARANVDGQCEDVACPGLFSSSAGGVVLACGAVVTSSVKLAADVDGGGAGCPGSGLTVLADKVTIDLNGHAVKGDGVGASDRGITFADRMQVTIKNGTVEGFAIGVNAGPFATKVTLSNVLLQNNHAGASIHGDFLTVARSAFLGNADGGLFWQGSNGHAKVTSSYFVANGGRGVETVTDPNFFVLSGSVVANNTGDGLHFQNGANDDVVVSSIVARNGGRGVFFEGQDFGRNLVSKSIVAGNTFDGVTLSNTDATVPPFGGPSRVLGNVVAGNGFNGVQFQADSDGNVLEKNRLLGNGLDGFFNSADSGGTQVRSNTTIGNTDDGLDSDGNTTFAKNVAVANGDLGVDAVMGAVDGGGNKARANVNVLQCATFLTCG